MCKKMNWLFLLLLLRKDLARVPSSIEKLIWYKPIFTRLLLIQTTFEVLNVKFTRSEAAIIVR